MLLMRRGLRSTRKPMIESGSDEELEALLRRELMEIASFNGLDEEIVQKILSNSGLDR